jgi:hypothetical protein
MASVNDLDLVLDQAGGQVLDLSLLVIFVVPPFPLSIEVHPCADCLDYPAMALSVLLDHRAAVWILGVMEEVSDNELAGMGRENYFHWEVCRSMVAAQVDNDHFAVEAQQKELEMIKVPREQSLDYRFVAKWKLGRGPLGP